MDQVSFSASAADLAIIAKLADRALAMQDKAGREAKFRRSRLDFQMDLTAVHANGCPLDLKLLESADDFNFAHDIFGIERHLDRSTGQLTDCFLPRFAAKS